MGLVANMVLVPPSVGSIEKKDVIILEVFGLGGWSE
jgi:hypothetical protein